MMCTGELRANQPYTLQEHTDQFSSSELSKVTCVFGLELSHLGLILEEHAIDRMCFFLCCLVPSGGASELGKICWHFLLGLLEHAHEVSRVRFFVLHTIGLTSVEQGAH